MLNWSGFSCDGGSSAKLFCSVGKGSIINTKSIIEQIAILEIMFISLRAMIAGNVLAGSYMIGIGSKVINNIKIKRCCYWSKLNSNKKYTR